MPTELNQGNMQINKHKEINISLTKVTELSIYELHKQNKYVQLTKTVQRIYNCIKHEQQTVAQLGLKQGGCKVLKQ